MNGIAPYLLEVPHSAVTAQRSITVRTIEPVPWKNGGGHTRVLASGHGWRVSIAEVMRDCVFSVFEGERRHSVIVDGGGARLQCHGQEVSLEPRAVATYPGGFAWNCHLEQGAVRILNVICAPSVADVEVQTGSRITLQRDDACTTIVLAVGGAARVAGDRGCERMLPDGDFLMQNDVSGSLSISTDEQHAYAVAIRIRPNDQQAQRA